MTREEEIAFIQKIIEHPAGFNLDLLGLLSVTGNEDLTWEVEYEGGKHEKRYKECRTSKEAARLFVEWRHELEIGIDIEEQLFDAKQTRVTMPDIPNSK